MSASQKGKPNNFAGKKHSKEVKEKNRIAHTGENNQHWKGGISKLSTYPNNYKISKQEKLAKRPKPKQCEICGAFGQICFDHDHITGAFRGWICHRCNLVLGFIKDSRDLLNKLIEYLDA